MPRERPNRTEAFWRRGFFSMPFRGMRSGRRGFAVVLVLGLFFSMAGSMESGSLKPSERLLLYPGLGRQRGDHWEIQIHGLVYEPERRRLMAAALRRVIGLDEELLTVVEKAIYEERSSYFLVDDERGKRLVL